MSMHACRKVPLVAAFALVAVSLTTPASASEALNDRVVAPAPAVEAAASPADAFARKRHPTAQRAARPVSADAEIARLAARLAALTAARRCNYLGCSGYMVVGVQY